MSHTDEGQALAYDLVTSDAGRDLARDLANSATGRALALDLAGSVGGRDLARDLPESGTGRKLARSLADSATGRKLALSLAESGTGRALALDLANSAISRELALDLAESDTGRELARILADSATNQNLAGGLLWASALLLLAATTLLGLATAAVFLVAVALTVDSDPDDDGGTVIGSSDIMEGVAVGDVEGGTVIGLSDSEGERYRVSIDIGPGATFGQLAQVLADLEVLSSVAAVWSSIERDLGDKSSDEPGTTKTVAPPQTKLGGDEPVIEWLRYTNPVAIVAALSVPFVALLKVVSDWKQSEAMVAAEAGKLVAEAGKVDAEAVKLVAEAGKVDAEAARIRLENDLYAHRSSRSVVPTFERLPRWWPV